MIILVFLQISLCFAVSQEASYHILEDMHTFSTDYPRSENSEGERKSLRFITESLEELGVVYKVQNLDSFEDFHSFSATVEVFFPGAGEGELFLLFPLNHPVDATREADGSAGLALALQVCRSLAKTPPPIDVRVLFVGAEFGRDRDYQRGTRAFLRNYSSHGEGALLYIDLKRLPTRLEFQPAGNGRVAPAWLVKYTTDILAEKGIPYEFSTIAFNIQQMGFNETETRIDPFLEEDIPAVYLGSFEAEDSEAVSGAEGISPTELTALIMSFIGNFHESIPQRWDRHYLFFKIGEAGILMPELSYVLMLLILFSTVLLYPFFQRKRFYRYMRSMRKHAWVMPILVIFMFLYLLVSTYLVEALSRLRGIPFLWRDEPFLILTLKISFAALLFSLSHRITRRFHLGRLRGSFYSASGLIFLLINVLILTFFNLSLTIYGAGLFLLGFLFTLSRARLMKLVFLIVSVLSIFALLLQSFRTDSPTVLYGVLLSHFRGNLLISFFLLPYMLFILRLKVLYHSPSRPVAKRFTLFTELIFGLLSISLVLYFTFFYTPADTSGQDLRVTEKINTNHTIRFESPLPLQEFSFNTLNGNRKTLPPGEPQNRITLRLPPFEGLLSVDLDTKEFLGRTTYSVDLSSPHSPEEIEVILTSAEEVTLYDSDFPATLRSDRSGVRFHIGRNPAFPFTFSFTVPRELEGNLTVTADYHTPPYDLGIDQKKFEVDYTLTASISSTIPPIVPPTGPAEEKREEEKEQLTPSTP